MTHLRSIQDTLSAKRSAASSHPVLEDSFLEVRSGFKVAQNCLKAAVVCSRGCREQFEGVSEESGGSNLKG